jgi:hypothetical protein
MTTKNEKMNMEKTQPQQQKKAPKLVKGTKKQQAPVPCRPNFM